MSASKADTLREVRRQLEAMVASVDEMIAVEERHEDEVAVWQGKFRHLRDAAS